MVKYCECVWYDEERALLMTKSGDFIVEECCRGEPNDLYLCSTFQEAISCLCNLKWGDRLDWDDDEAQYFLDTVKEIIEEWEGIGDRKYPINTVEDLRDIKDFSCREKIKECNEICVHICSQELRDMYTEKFGCICGACSKRCLCYKNHECDSPDEQ